MYCTEITVNLVMLVGEVMPGLIRPEQIPVFTFNPIKLIFFVGWIYLCMYSVQRVEYSSLISKEYKAIASFFSLLIGPLLLFVLLVADTANKLQEGKTTVDQIWDKVFSGLFTREKHTYFKGNEYIEILNSSGKSFKEVYGGHSKSKELISKTITLTENVILDAINNRASDILIDPTTDMNYTIRFRIDGFLRNTSSVEGDRGVAIINSLKAISGMDIAEKRRPQDGAFMATITDGNVYFRMASAGVLGGEKLSIRVLNQSTGLLNLEDIGATEKNLEIISSAVKQPSGMIILCGPTGSGKTTSLYAMLNTIDFYTRNVITVEDPVEYVLAQTSQIEVNVKANITFGNALLSILRQDPDVICVGEIRDTETAAMALQASQTGHLVLATMHSSSNMATLVRLMELGIKPLLLASALNLIVSQRLVRKLCEYCKCPAGLTQEQIVEFKQRGVDAKNIKNATGCPECSGTRYTGRTAIMDVLVLDDSIKAILADNKLTPGDLKKKGDIRGRSALRREGMKKILQGETTIEEVKRVTTNLE